MKLFVSLVLIIILNQISLLAQNETRIRGLLAQADSLVALNKFQDALSKTNQVLEISHENQPALQKKINILFLMNDEKESVRMVDEAIKKYPDNGTYYYLRGIINNGREKYSKALEDFSQAIELKPQEILYKCYLGRGVSYLKLLELDEALSDLTESINQNDTIASAYYSRALINYELRDYNSAVNDFQKSLNFSSGNAALYFNLGMSYYRLNNKEKSCFNFNKSCSMGNINACKMSLMECAKAIPTVK